MADRLRCWTIPYYLYEYWSVRTVVQPWRSASYTHGDSYGLANHMRAHSRSDSSATFGWFIQLGAHLIPSGTYELEPTIDRKLYGITYSPSSFSVLSKQSPYPSHPVETDFRRTPFRNHEFWTSDHPVTLSQTFSTIHHQQRSHANPFLSIADSSAAEYSVQPVSLANSNPQPSAFTPQWGLFAARALFPTSNVSLRVRPPTLRRRRRHPWRIHPKAWAPRPRVRTSSLRKCFPGGTYIPALKCTSPVPAVSVPLHLPNLFAFLKPINVFSTRISPGLSSDLLKMGSFKVRVTPASLWGSTPSIFYNWQVSAGIKEEHVTEFSVRFSDFSGNSSDNSRHYFVSCFLLCLWSRAEWQCNLLRRDFSPSHVYCLTEKSHLWRLGYRRLENLFRLF